MKQFKQIFLILLSVIIGLIALLFGLLNTNSIQNRAKNILVEELQQKIDTEFGINRLYFKPFNNIGIDSLYLLGKDGEKILLVDKLTASIDLLELVKGKIVITSTRLADFEVHIFKQSSDSALNIQYLIDAFKPKDEEESKSKIDIKLNAINIENGKLFYDVIDRQKKVDRFDENHIAISNLNAKLALKSLLSDSLNIQIRKFGFKEQSGLIVDNFVGRLISKDDNYSIKGVELLLPNSKIEFDKLNFLIPNKQNSDSLTPHSHDDDIKIDCSLAQSYIAPRDLAAFVPELHNLEDRVMFRADISGYEHRLKMSNLTLTYGNKLSLVANAEAIDWIGENDTYVLASIDELKMSGKDIEKMVNTFSTKKVVINKGILSQENISFRGDISGYFSQLTAFGSLDTDNGFVNTDVVLGFNKKEKALTYAKGKIYTSDFKLGGFFDNDNFGNISFNVEVDIEKPLYQNLKGKIKGIVHDFELRDYIYQDINLDVFYDNNKVEGSLNINDLNGQLSLVGYLDMSDKELPKLDVKARASNIQLEKLKIAKNMQNSLLSFDMDANFEGSNIDNAEGYIFLDSLEFARNELEFKLDTMLVQVSGYSKEKNRKIAVKSDILNGYVKGRTSFVDLMNHLKYSLNKYLPALLPNIKSKPKLSNDFEYHFDIANTENLSDILKLPVIIYSPASINGFYNSTEDLFRLEVKAPLLRAGGMNIASAHILAENNQDVINTEIKAFVEGKNQVLNNITIKSKGNNNVIESTIELVNDAKRKAEGIFHITTEFDRKGQKEELETKINFDESKLLLNNQNWKLEQSNITIEQQFISVNDFRFYSEDMKQELKINGKYSKYNPKNILKAELKNIDLEYIFETLAIDALKFGGAASGNLFVSSIEEKPYANTRLEVDGFKFNGTELGKLNLYSELDEKTNEVIMDGLVVSKENKKTKVDGVLDPVNQRLSIHFDADSIDISFLHTYAASVFDKVRGRGTGQVHLHGDFSNVTVEGMAEVTDGAVGIKFLNTDYSFSDVIYLREGLIYFNDIQFKDKKGNIAYGSGKIAHDYFRNIMYHIELDANNFLVYNATQDLNPVFYGEVYGSGKGILSGDEREINIDINMQTQENTLVRMNFMENRISEYSFMSYVEPQEKEEALTKQQMLLHPIKTDSGMNINMSFYIDATPDATVELVMDPVGGDILRGSGSGAMQFIWSSKLEPQLYGTFNVSRGSYNFTFQKIMERIFSIEDGSTVQFRGDPFQALLNVSAIYKVTASLNDLDSGLVKQVGQSSVPVQCVLNLTGQLQRPNVGLDIRFPTANADATREIKSYMDTEDMINRQVTYLLLLSKFYTPDAGNVEYPSSEFAVVASATLSSQLTKVINQVDDRFQLGTHIRLSDSELNSTELELLLSSQLLNNRLIINGNFGYRDDKLLNNESVITDVEIEYFLNKSGTWRIKAYNHYNEKYYYLKPDKGVQTQGVGIMYRRDFDSLKELFGLEKKKNKVSLNKSTDHIVVPDSIQKGSRLSNFVRIKE